MGVRTTWSDGGYFIYDSVSGLAIGEIWDDADQMEKFLEYYKGMFDADMRIVPPEDLSTIRKEFLELEIGSST
jgi:hypothetical protein